jgi:hypothetical protein
MFWVTQKLNSTFSWSVGPAGQTRDQVQPIDARVDEPDGEGAPGRHRQAPGARVVLGLHAPPRKAHRDRDQEDRQQSAAHDPELPERLWLDAVRLADVSVVWRSSK